MFSPPHRSQAIRPDAVALADLMECTGSSGVAVYGPHAADGRITVSDEDGEPWIGGHTATLIDGVLRS